MSAVQLMCARLGLVTGRGLAGVIRLRYPAWVLWFSCLLLLVANVFNIGADLGGMGEAMQMVTGVPSWYYTPCFAVAIILLLFYTSYRVIAKIFKWLTLTLFAYVITAFLAHPDWRAVLWATLVPHIEFDSQFLSVLVGILGTTISPYLFFWQAAQEVEEEIAQGKTTIAQRRGATPDELARAKTDVVTGMAISNLVMYFIILTTASTLHAHGVKNIETAEQAAEALKPLAGPAAFWLFTLGIVGTGMLAVPVLAGSCAYAMAEAMRWRKASLESKPHLARRFYMVNAVAMVVGLALDFAGINAVRMLFLSAVVNGLLAPPLVVIVVLLTSDKKVMGQCTNSGTMKVLGWLCAVAMFAAGAGLIVTSLR
jgi:NRAMP (natural resistance-associated macrophage protein)-like metal ion transporter